MAARRGRGGHGRGNMENLENNRDAEIQALRRQVEELTLRLEHQEARSERGSSHGYASDDSEHVNPFADRNVRNFVEKINRTADVKVDIPEFHGRLQPEGFLDWLSAVDKFFEYKDIPDGQKVKLVATRLRGYASAWWDKTQDMRLRKGKSKIISWEKMKARLRQNFLPANFAQTIFMQFNTLQQGNKSVTDYTEEFYRLMARIDNQESEDQLVARYVNGLKATIKDEVEMQQLWKLNDAYQLALKVESKLLRHGAKKFADVRSFYPSKESTSKGLLKKSGNKDGAYSASKNKPISCFKCGQPGHYMNECPKRRSDTRAGVVEKEEEEPPFEEDSPRYDDDEHDREEIEPEEGECLVIQKVLAAPKQDENRPWLRHNIFRTRCKSHGKVCSLVIDGGSFENFVSQEMVDKLKLTTIPHPHPYSVSWIKKDNEVRIDKKCLISFSMGKNYRDEVWCDVTPMDVGHILLGRPWQYDRSAIHDGRKNTYTFVVGKTEIVLLPCKDICNSKSFTKEEENALLTLPQLEKKRPKQWDSILSRAEFAYNSVANRSTGKSPFEIVYGRSPTHYLDLTEVPTSSKKVEDFASTIERIQEEVKKKLLESYQSYKRAADVHRRIQVFKEGDLVWVYLKKERIYYIVDYEDVTSKRANRDEETKQLKELDCKGEVPSKDCSHNLAADIPCDGLWKIPSGDTPVPLVSCGKEELEGVYSSRDVSKEIVLNPLPFGVHEDLALPRMLPEGLFTILYLSEFMRT
ncbi:hypothetical protein ZIOFF_035708 [Zingiber officinale]|uniref:CCHC-type domain-containing protein n=1 Tax=Zingiber officinale TaxID=94328 RepID=A0A8J5L7A8_ZINOF|nr:hypothetical protein ZIOFF_035708 [Zingiber officinale]